MVQPIVGGVIDTEHIVAHRDVRGDNRLAYVIPASASCDSLPVMVELAKKG